MKLECGMIEKIGGFHIYSILKITMIFTSLSIYVITQFHAYREEKVIVTGGEIQDETDWGSDWGKTCFVGPSPTFLASLATLNLFDNPV